jgi:thymidylate kinase
MDTGQRHELIIVEGLTGSGKSILAHFIARQLQGNGVKAVWVHEGESPHPVSLDVESSIEGYMEDMLDRWTAFGDQIEASQAVTVVEACFFNNLIESLLAHNVGRSRIIQYGDALQEIVEPLNPALVYLTQSNVSKALEKSFSDRGEGFENYVIRYATGTPFARHRGLEGYAGMLTFWREFVALTDELFHRYRIKKLMIDTSAGDWDCHNRQVLGFLALPQVSEPRVSACEVARLVGTYRDEKHGKEFIVECKDGELFINLFLDVRTRLIRKTDDLFYAEGWRFEICFEGDESGHLDKMIIGGRDVDYLALAGTVATRAPTC